MNYENMITIIKTSDGVEIPPETVEKIINAANDIVAAGNESPTNAEVLRKIKRGSLSHVSPVMRAWRSAQKEDEAATLEIPEDLKKFIETSVGRVWASASKLSLVKVEAIAKETDAKLNEISNERDEAYTAITTLEERISELELKYRDAKKFNEIIEKNHDDIKLKYIEQKGGNESLNYKVEDKDMQLSKLRSELDAERNKNISLQKDLVKIAMK